MLYNCFRESGFLMLMRFGVELFHIYFIYVHNSPYLFVCGDDQVTCYPRADDATGEPRDA